MSKKAFDFIFLDALAGNGRVYFVDGPGGTGKSFLYKVFLSHIRSRGHIELIMSSSGIAAAGFLGGRTTHSRFNIPIDGGPNLKFQVSFQSGETELIWASIIIIWDEAHMTEKNTICALNDLLQFLCENKLFFAGKLVVFGGDFRHVFIPRGSKKEQIDAIILSFSFWEDIIKLKLTYNMRAKDDPAFVDFLMRIGNGQEPKNQKGEIRIPKPMLIPYTYIDELL